MGGSFSQITSFTTPRAVSTAIGSELTETLIGSEVNVQPPLDTSTVICWPLVGFSWIDLFTDGAP